MASTHSGCTEESPCSNPVLRWVHSNRCQIGCLGRTVTGMRKLLRDMKKERDGADEIRTATAVQLNGALARIAMLETALRDECSNHSETCKCPGCLLVFADEPAQGGGCPGCPPPAHEHHEGMNECAICDEPVLCAKCGKHAELHGPGSKCRKYVRPSCSRCAPKEAP